MKQHKTYCCEFPVLKHLECQFSLQGCPHDRSAALRPFPLSCFLHSCSFFILLFLAMATPGGMINAQDAVRISQTLEMEFKFPSVFDLQLLPEKATIKPPEENSGPDEDSLHWFEITGDENVEMIVHVHPANDSVRAYYINSGIFDSGQAVPFPGSQAAFVLNPAPRNSASPEFFKAWIGIRANEKCRLTFEYP